MNADSPTSQPNARLVINLTALRRGIVAGLVVIVPVSLIVALVSNRHVSGYGGWLFVAFVATLYGYATAGYGAARTQPEAPLSHGILAGLGALFGWLLVRLAVPLAARHPLRFGIVDVITHATFAVTLGALGGLFAARRGPTAIRPERPADE